ncbi:MAG: hypothetical protein KKH94_10925 [Candidatus Omnitrophica bacterium]|nr:hypothetical protein [Candidatus Omnitrophota bacterium]
MNWFERYGIVGSYFMMITFLWIKCFLVFEIKDYYIAAFIFSVLPIGYLLTVFAQWLYYKGIWGPRIHKEIFDFMRLHLDEKERTKLGLPEKSDEAMCEAKLAVLHRLTKVESAPLEHIKYLADFCTRRWDVISINGSIMLSTILSFMFSILLSIVLSQYGQNFIYRENHWPLSIAMLIFSIIVFFALVKSKRILNNQIRAIHKDLFKKIYGDKAQE